MSNTAVGFGLHLDCHPWKGQWQCRAGPGHHNKIMQVVHDFLNRSVKAHPVTKKGVAAGGVHLSEEGVKR